MNQDCGVYGNVTGHRKAALKGWQMRRLKRLALMAVNAKKRKLLNATRSQVIACATMRVASKFAVVGFPIAETEEIINMLLG